jgi:hypothetical protein
MRFRELALAVRLAGLLMLLAAVGCGERETAAPKKDLSEKEKQQIRELNEQRATEWASTKRK